MFRILIADDHSIVRKGVRQILTEGFPDAEIDEVPDAESLIKKIIDMEIIEQTMSDVLPAKIQIKGKDYQRSDFLDHGSASVPVFFIGASTKKGSPPYKLTHIYEASINSESRLIVLTESNLIKDKNIIICSKQYLQNKNISWLKNIIFDITFIDESHNGGTTELAKNILNNYSKDSFTIQITATYSKPSNDFNISKDNWILWSLEDINLCKYYNLEKIIEKHGNLELINNYLRSDKSIKIVIYGKNCNDDSIHKKYQQLLSLGFYNVYAYNGGMFEWLMLQDIYGAELFPCTKLEKDILKFKPHSMLNIVLLEN